MKISEMRLFNILAIIGSALALECEVCNTFLGKAQKILAEEKITDVEKIENKLRKMCKDAKEQDNRFCYYTGLAADAATTMHKVNTYKRLATLSRGKWISIYR